MYYYNFFVDIFCPLGSKRAPLLTCLPYFLVANSSYVVFWEINLTICSSLYTQNLEIQMSLKIQYIFGSEIDQKILFRNGIYNIFNH